MTLNSLEHPCFRRCKTMCNNMEKIKVFDIETVISWCADVVEEYETIKKEGYSFENSEESKRKEE